MDEKRENTQLIEATSKRYKGLQAAGVVMLCIGVATCGIASGGDSSGGTTFGTTLALLGFGLYVAGRFGAWWKHG